MMTAILVLSTVAIWIIFDIWVYLKKGYNETISAIIYNASKRWPFLMFFGGLLAGHFWWPMVLEVCSK